MNKKFLLKSSFALIFSLTALTVSAQNTALKGTVIDSRTEEPLIGATVIIPGTTTGAITDVNGGFTLNGLKRNTENTIEISYMGYKNDTLIYKPTRAVNNAGIIKLDQDNVELSTVVVQGQAPIAVQMGDTTQFNAGAYKTNPDATAEDLLSKMPGFTVSNGTAEVQGEEITQVYVDGKAYFKNDLASALSSLPADAIESIQLFDEQSDQSRFTGFDDGNTTKTINIITKAKKNNAYFGDYIAGYGTDNRYNIKTNTNIFQGDNRFTLGVGSNNINQSSVSGGRFYGGFGRSGIQTSTGVKFNYSGEFIKSPTRKTEIGGNYVYTNSQDKLEKMLEQSYFPSTDYESRNYTEAYTSNTTTNRHSLRFDLESDLNENNRIYFRPSATFSNSSANQLTDALTYIDGIKSNDALTDKSTDSHSYNINTNLTWMHRFSPKHSLSIRGNFRLNRSNSDQYLIGDNGFYETDEWVEEVINQETENIGNDNTAGVRLTYSYAINKTSGLTFNYESSYTWNTSDKKTYLYNPETGLYEDIDLSLSNVLKRDYFTNTAGAGYSYNIKDKIRLNIGADFENAALQNKHVFPTSKAYDYNFNSVLANLRFDYYFSKNKRLSFTYRGRSELPSMTQLQDVVDNTNPLKISTGNPNLDKSYNNSFRINYTASNIEKSTFFGFFASVNNTMNSIANNARFITEDTEINGVFVQKGAQVTSPVNLNGEWRANIGTTYAFPVTALQSSINLMLGYNISKKPSIYNDIKSHSLSNGVMFNFAINSNISENLDFTISSGTSVTYANSSNSSSSDNTYVNERVGIRFNWIFWKGFVLNADYSYNYSYYSSNGPANPNYNLLNMGIGKKFLRNQNAEIRISAFDLLNQSKSLSHSVNDIYIEDSRSSVLQRYFMLTFSYKFNTMQGKSSGTSSRGGFAPRPGGGPGMMPPPPRF